MWLVDHVMAFLIEGGEFFEITIDATLLGITVVLCGLFVWGVILLVKGKLGGFKNITSQM
jgi:hypothetical protein